MKNVALPLLLLLSACATVTSSSDQDVRVTTDPAGAACTLRNDLGRWSIDKTPGSAAVHRSFSPLHISCSKDGKTATHIIDGKTRGRAYGNLLLLGIPAGVDAATGYGYEYDPDSVELKLE